jgi:hypothetical protein
MSLRHMSEYTMRRIMFAWAKRVLKHGIRPYAVPGGFDLTPDP